MKLGEFFFADLALYGDGLVVSMAGLEAVT